ncbi:LysE family translocator [Pseudomonas coleopterorum]|jgi:threonine/homoserine/homoserine lactone efflux protein|uniref:LysE family translocator n=1 Tax=Pseudomonas coleopterorum TaxID=1605838 RepID=A0ABR9C0I6_9PSED|nr:LysE family translocator [Pseudomonas coleopterorum]MBD8757766.1 LysE family translocator [Pseudomonas coleopterorum]MBD8770811.1 LysE family translocator [Pseudomonas coleopterorum]
MDLTTLLLFIPACFALNMAPGPNNLLSINNAAHHGYKAACLAGFGRLVAFSGMIALAAMGLAAVLFASEWLFLVIKTVGALYLLWLAWSLWTGEPADMADDATASRPSLWLMLRREFLIAAGNPKAILIFTAFLPQFVDPQQPVGAQFAVLGALFLILEWIAVGLYAYLGVNLKRWLNTVQAKRRFNRACGGLLGLAGVGLLFARRGHA